MSVDCHNRPFISRLSRFSCSTGLRPGPGGGADHEEGEGLNLFTATGLKGGRGGRTKVTAEPEKQVRAIAGYCRAVRLLARANGLIETNITVSTQGVE